jgi:Domain of Unknown Function with PDB structure (DUF3857)
LVTIVFSFPVLAGVISFAGIMKLRGIILFLPGLRKVKFMKSYPPFCLRFSLFLCVLASFAAPTLAASDDWKPIDPAHLSLKSSTVEKEADAEGLFWEVRIADSPEIGGVIFDHYLRVKVFTERGRESQSKIDIPFGNIYGAEIKIKDIAARTIKPDGTIVELKKEDIFERTIVKLSGLTKWRS